MIVKTTIMIIIIGWLSVIKNIKNYIKILISLEIILISISILILNSSILFDDIDGAITTIFILCIGAAETAIGLSILINYYRINN